MLIKLLGPSPWAVIAKAPVVTDVVGDGHGCVEAARGLQDLVGGSEGMGCSSLDRGLEN